MKRSSLLPWLPLHAVLCLLWGACNPLSLAAAFLLGPSHPTGTNVTAWSPVPFVLTGAAVAALSQGPLGAALWRLNRGHLSAARVAAGLQLAQLPFLPFLLLTSMAFSGLEGNIVGFFVAPGALLYLGLSAPVSIAILGAWIVVARRRAQPPAGPQA
ncbi:MAG: hypothetical protein RL653_3959 [Pseudomonadota bacterium]|jgi:hypothetical protein